MSVPKSTADFVIFAINAAIRLGRNSQRAYARSLRSRAILMPLPRFDEEPSHEVVRRYFDNSDPEEGGRQYLAAIAELEDLHQRHSDLTTERPLSDEELTTYVDYFKKLRASQRQEQIEATGSNDPDRIHSTLSTQELVAMMHLRQFTVRPSDQTSPLQMVAGTLVEIGIDYFNQIPGALNQDSVLARALHPFLNALDRISFSDRQRLRSQTNTIVPSLFAAAIESVSAMDLSLSADPKVQTFIEAVGEGVVSDLYKKMESVPVDRERDLLSWTELVLRSMVANAGHYVFEAPDRLFTDLDAGSSQLIRETGIVLLDFILEDPDQLQIKSAFHTDALNKVMQAAFQTLAQHPQLITEKQGFHQIITGVSSAMAQSNFRDPGYVPEFIRLMLEKTAGNLHLFLKSEPGEGDYVLVTALREVLHSMTAQGEEVWRLRFSKDQLLEVVNLTFDSVLQNPQWLEKAVSGQPLLTEVLQTTFQALRALEVPLQTANWTEILHLNLNAVAQHQTLLDRIPWGDDASEKALLQRGLDMLFRYVAKAEHLAPAERLHLLPELVNYGLNIVLTRHPNRNGLVLLELITDEHLHIGRTNGPGPSQVDQLFEAALAVLASRADLVTQQNGFQQTISQVARGLQRAELSGPDLLPQLAALVFHHSAENAALILRTDQSQPKYLLALALEQVLTTFAPAPDRVHWRPRFTGGELIQFATNTLQTLTLNPQWLLGTSEEESLWAKVVREVTSGLQRLPTEQHLQPDTLQYVLYLSLRAASQSPQVLSPNNDSLNQTFLSYTLDFFVKRVFDEQGKPTVDTPIQYLSEMADFVLDEMIIKYPDKRGIHFMHALYDSGLNWDHVLQRGAFFDFLGTGLTAMEQAGLIGPGDELIPKVLRHTTIVLRNAGLVPEDWLTSIYPSVLNDSLALHRRLKPEDDSLPIVAGLDQALKGMHAFFPEGDWRRRFQPVELIDLMQYCTEQVLNNPEWVKQSRMRRLIEGVASSLHAIGNRRTISSRVLNDLLADAFFVSNRRLQLIDGSLSNIGNGTTPLQATLQTVLQILFQNNADSPATFYLGQPEQLTPILRTALERIAVGPVHMGTVNHISESLRLGIERINNNEAFEIEELLTAIRQTETGIG